MISHGLVLSGFNLLHYYIYTVQGLCRSFHAPEELAQVPDILRSGKPPPQTKCGIIRFARLTRQRLIRHPLLAHHTRLLSYQPNFLVLGSSPHSKSLLCRYDHSFTD